MSSSPAAQDSDRQQEVASEELAPAILVKGLTKYYGRMCAIDDVSFRVEKGEVVGFLGPNGAGKSTTLRILSGIISATRGEAWISGVSVAREAARVKQLIGYMPENNPLPEDLRVIEYLRLRGKLKNLRGKILKERMEAVMEICDLNRKARRRIIGTLSKGFRQRVGVADALLAEPEVIILDEPTIGLDPHQIRAVRQLISSLRGEMTVILSSHILSEIEMCCDRVMIINQGQIVASGTPDSLRKEFVQVKRYRLEFRGSPTEVEGAIRASGLPLECIEAGQTLEGPYHTLLLQGPATRDCGEELATLFSGMDGVRLGALERIHPSLEDIFLAATLRTWDESIGGQGDSRAPFSLSRSTNHS